MQLGELGNEGQYHLNCMQYKSDVHLHLVSTLSDMNPHAAAQSSGFGAIAGNAGGAAFGSNIFKVPVQTSNFLSPQKAGEPLSSLNECDVIALDLLPIRHPGDS